MKRQAGFTLVELMVAVAIIGILFVTAIPVYHTWQQRAYGSEAAIMLKQLINAEIAYFLDNDDFFPPADTDYHIRHEGAPDPADAISDIEQNLNITIPQGHFIEYDLYGGDEFVVVITSYNFNFDIFKGTPQIYATLDKDGESNIYYASYD